MKTAVTISRIFTGCLFIFSGLVKAIDPRGLAYKMQEFFEAWAGSGFLPGLMSKLDHYALAFAVIMITLEVIAGVALLIGFKRTFTTWLLFLLMLFFTFLTAYVLFTGKIKACGCFGDCIPITPVQTFTKDIILLILATFLLIKRRYILPIAKPFINGAYILIACILVLLLQNHVLKNLPLIDCLPYKKGNDIAAMRKMPANAIPDKFDYHFVYEKGGIKKEFKADATPDSTWTFVDRKQVLVEKGSNNLPLINDFSLTTESGMDTTDAILSTPGEYYLLFIKDLDGYAVKHDEDIIFIANAMRNNKKVIVVSSQVEKIKGRIFNHKLSETFINRVPVLSCDATVLKTIARVNPTLYLMNGAIVKDKWSINQFKDLEK